MKNDSEIVHAASPLGTLQLEFRCGALTKCRLVVSPQSVPETLLSDAAKLALRELEEYFAGKRRSFSIPLDAAGTPFQLAVWAALRSIPYGGVRTYGEVARMIGKPKAVRAVGGACHANPVIVITPCHRVVAANGAGGFGGGLENKRKLLSLETGDPAPFGFKW